MVPVLEAEQRFETSTPSTESSSDTTSVETTDASAGSDDSADTTPMTSPLPVPGVYVYDPTGRGSVDALSGAHHDYPATTITVTPTACGVQQRWDILEQRWQQWQRCTENSGISEPERTNYDEFFGQPQTDTWMCSGDARPPTAAAGATWTTTCTSGTATATYDGVVIGTESQDVGSTKIATMHVQVTIIDDTSSDSQIIDTWYSTGSDLVVAQTSSVATSNDSPVGTVHYTETYEIHLTLLTPLRWRCDGPGDEPRGGDGSRTPRC